MKLYLTSTLASSIDKIDFEGKKKLAFCATAADVYKDKWFVEDSRKAFTKKGLELTEIDIKEFSGEELFEKLGEFDFVFFSGGSSIYLLYQMKNVDFDKIVNKLLESVVYIGSSAGSAVCCPNLEYVFPMDKKREDSPLENYDGLGLVNFYLLPHYGREKYAHLCKEILDKNKDKEVVTITDEELIIVDENGWKKL